MPHFNDHVHICPDCGANWDCTDQDCTNPRTYECNDCFAQANE